MSTVARWTEHVTLTTGHSRRSYLDEVSDEALAAMVRACAPLAEDA